MVASIDVRPPVKATRNFEGYDGDVMRPGSTFSSLRRLLAQPCQAHDRRRAQNRARLRSDSC